MFAYGIGGFWIDQKDKLTSLPSQRLESRPCPLQSPPLHSAPLNAYHGDNCRPVLEAELSWSCSGDTQDSAVHRLDDLILGVANCAGPNSLVAPSDLKAESPACEARSQACPLRNLLRPGPAQLWDLLEGSWHRPPWLLALMTKTESSEYFWEAGSCKKSGLKCRFTMSCLLLQASLLDIQA